MKKLLLLCFLVTAVFTAKGQNIVQYTAEGKIGFKDSSGKIIIPAKYESVSKVDNYYYSVKSNDKYGIIDNHGKEIIKLKFKFINKISENIFSVMNDNYKVGIIDSNGKEILSITNNSLHFLPLSEDVYITMTTTWSDGKFGFIDKSGKEIVAPKYENLRPCSEGIIAGKLKDKWGFIKKNGEEIIPFIYTGDVQSFSEGLAVVGLDQKYGFIDKSGKVVIPIIYDSAKSFYKGLAIVRLNDKYLMIDKNGKAIKELKYTSFFRWSRDGLINVKLDKKYGRIDMATGKEIIPTIYDDIDSFDEDFSSWVQLNKKWGVIDKLGKIIVPIQYDEKESLYEYGNYNYKVQINKKYGLLDASKKELTEVKYDSIGNFSEGFALVKIGDKFGFIDLLGQELKPIIYDYGTSFSEGYATIINNRHWSFLNTKGEEMPLYYKELEQYQLIDSFKEGLCRVKFDDKIGYVNKKGTIIIQPIYYEASNFDGGLAKVKINNKWGLIDYIGNEFLPLEYDKIDSLKDDNIIATKNGKEFYFDKKGKEIEKPINNKNTDTTR